MGIWEVILLRMSPSVMEQVLKTRWRTSARRKANARNVRMPNLQRQFIYLTFVDNFKIQKYLKVYKMDLAVTFVLLSRFKKTNGIHFLCFGFISKKRKQNNQWKGLSGLFLVLSLCQRSCHKKTESCIGCFGLGIFPGCLHTLTGLSMTKFKKSVDHFSPG